jgi:5-methylcytosine-specific restriction protein A
LPGKPQSFRVRGQGTVGSVNADYDRRRGSARQRGYDARWDRLAAIEKRCHPLCVGCLAIGRTAATEVIDHIMPHKGDRVLFWAPDNRQAACTWHHSVVKQVLEARFAKGEIGSAALRLDSDAAIALSLDLLDLAG